MQTLVKRTMLLEPIESCGDSSLTKMKTIFSGQTTPEPFWNFSDIKISVHITLQFLTFYEVAYLLFANFGKYVNMLFVDDNGENRKR